MAEELEKTKQYKYQSNANLVIQRGGSDIGGIGRHESGPTGESSTLSTVECSSSLHAHPCTSSLQITQTPTLSRQHHHSLHPLSVCALTQFDQSMHQTPCCGHRQVLGRWNSFYRTVSKI